MANKGSKILIAILVVALIYIFGLILATSPGFQAEIRKRINEKTGTSASGQAALSEEELARIIGQETAGVDGKIQIGPPVDPSKLAKQIVGLIDTDAVADLALDKIDFDAAARELDERIDGKIDEKIDERIKAAIPRQSEEQEDRTVKKTMKAVLDSPRFDAQIAGAVENQTVSLGQMLSSMLESGVVSEMVLSALQEDSEKANGFLPSWLGSHMPSQTRADSSYGSEKDEIDQAVQNAMDANTETNRRALEALVEENLTKEMVFSALESHPEYLEDYVSNYMAAHAAKSAPSRDEVSAKADEDGVNKALHDDPGLLDDAVGRWFAANKKTLVDDLARQVASSDQIGDYFANIVEDSAPQADQILSMMLDSDLIPDMVAAALESSPDLLKTAMADWLRENSEELAKAVQKASSPSRPSPAQDGIQAKPGMAAPPRLEEPSKARPTTQDRKVFPAKGQGEKSTKEGFSKRKAELRQKLLERINRGSEN